MTDEFDDDLIDEDILEETNGDVPKTEPVGDDADESDSRTRRAKEIGKKAGDVPGKALGVTIAFITSMTSTFVYTVTKFLPFIGEKFWKSAIETCTERYQKAAGADVVNFVHREAGTVEPVATNWVEGEDIGDKPGWKAVGEEKVWDAGAEGRGVERLGKADIIISDEAAWQVADPLKMRVSEALDLENVQPLVTNATLQQNIISAGTNGDGQPAMADGGAHAGPIQLDLMQHPEFDDFVIDLSPENPEADGMRISARKYKEMDMTKTSAEEMKNQETRGLLAGMAGNDNKSMLLKMALAAFGFVLLWEFGPWIISGLFGDAIGDMGGGGGNIPIMLDATATLLGVV